MLFRAIKSIFSMLPQAQAQAASEHDDKEKKSRRRKLLDVAEAKVLSEEARKYNMELASLIHQTGPVVIQGELREQVSKKVQALAAPLYQHPDIIDEVTDKLVDAAQYDEGIRRWFG